MAKAAAKTATKAGKTPAKPKPAAKASAAPAASAAGGYWIARVDVTDQTEYDAYRALNAKAFAKFGGRFIVRGGEFIRARGSSRQHNVVVAFPTLETAQACYASPEYKAAMQHLGRAGMADLVIIGGYDGPQP